MKLGCVKKIGLIALTLVLTACLSSCYVGAALNPGGCYWIPGYYDNSHVWHHGYWRCN